MLNGVQVAGLYQAVPRQPPGWTLQLAVANARTAVTRVTGLGGHVILLDRHVRRGRWG